MLKELFICCALTSSVAPAPNYYAPVNYEVAHHVKDYVLNDEYYEFLDFNGDGILSIADVVGIQRRYDDNVRYGNELTVDFDCIQAIFDENGIDCMYWEIDMIEQDVCREYEITVDRITVIDVYYETADFESGNIIVEVNPYEESIEVKN